MIQLRTIDDFVRLRAKYRLYRREYEIRNSPCGISHLEMSGTPAHNRTMELLLGCTELRIPDTLSDWIRDTSRRLRNEQFAK